LRAIARFRLLALALMLVVSHLALVSHVTAHFEPEWEECELCVSQTQPLAAIVVAGHGISAAECTEQSDFDHSPDPVRTLSCKAYHQRAPPVSFP